MAHLSLVRITDQDYKYYRRSFSKIEYSFSLKGEPKFVIPDEGKHFTDAAILKKGNFLDKLEKPGVEMYFVENEEKEIIGIINLVIEGSEATIETFAVFEKLKGLGREAYGLIKDLLLSKGVKKVFLQCPFRGSQVFWEKMGFNEILYIPFGYEARIKR